MSAIHANQNARVQFVQTKDVRARLTSRVYMHLLNMHFYVINLLYTRWLFCEYFQKCVESCSCLTHV